MAIRKHHSYSCLVGVVPPIRRSFTMNKEGENSTETLFDLQNLETNIRFCLMSGTQNTLDNIKVLEGDGKFNEPV